MHLLAFGMPWAFGGIEPFDALAYWGIGLMLLLWAVRIVAERRFAWRNCPVALGIAALFLFGIWQLTPLPPGLLAKLSPAGSALTQALLPRTEERLPGSELKEAFAPAAGTVLSLYPARTKQTLAQLLALFLFYVAVRNNCASVLVLRRLSMMAVFVGAALAFLALLQFATSDLRHAYWAVPVPLGTSVFGPFLCRSHFPFYLNLCIGLGIGLLFSLRFHAQGYVPPQFGAPRQRRSADDNPYELSHPPLLMRSWSEILHDNRVLWLFFPLVLMICSVVCSLSRGGLLALLLSGLVGVLFGVPKERRWAGFAVLVLFAGATAGLLSWLGFDFLESRHATLLRADALDDRLAIWRAVWPLAQQYPLTGAGYGTLMLAEPLNRAAGGDSYVFHTHAHNEYLEALAEGGVPRLLITLIVIGAVYWLAQKALARYRMRSAYGLTMGAVIAFSAAIIQSVVDFGLHVPSIALLFVAIVAQISAVALDPDPQRPTQLPPEESNEFVLRLYGLAPLAAATLLAALAAVLFAEGWRGERTFRLQSAAGRLNRRLDEALQQKPNQVPYLDLQELQQKVDFLRAAVAYTPDSAFLRLQLANALLLQLKGQEQEANRIATAVEIAQAVLGGGVAASVPLLSAECVDPQFFGGLAQAPLTRSSLQTRMAESAKPQSAEHLKQLLAARDLCPILPQPHLRIAENILAFRQADPRAAYLARAKRLRPFDANLWFECGTQEWFDGQFDEAVRSWRRCLELKDPDDPDAQMVFAAILMQAQRKPPAASPDGAAVLAPAAVETLFTPDQIMAKIVPDQPKMILAAVGQFFGKKEDAERRKPYLEKALALLGRPSDTDGVHTQALLLLSLDRTKEAEDALSKAVTLAPNRAEWRIELAQLYFDLKRYRESVYHLEQATKARPTDAQLKKLFDAAQEALKAQEAQERKQGK